MRPSDATEEKDMLEQYQGAIERELESAKKAHDKKIDNLISSKPAQKSALEKYKISALGLEEMSFEKYLEAAGVPGAHKFGKVEVGGRDCCVVERMSILSGRGYRKSGSRRRYSAGTFSGSSADRTSPGRT